MHNKDLNIIVYLLVLILSLADNTGLNVIKWNVRTFMHFIIIVVVLVVVVVTLCSRSL
jgi:hypothetical protein